MSFPENFLWGVAASAAQVEGSAFDGGRGISIWDVYARIPCKIADGSLPDITCDEYRRLEEHIALIKELGVKSYRFSFSWSRIFPEGKGRVNEEGIAYYRKLLNLLKENGIKAVATIYHWDLPYALQLMGGFGNRACVKWYCDYAKTLFDAFGDEIEYWTTFNEPIAVYVGYALGFFAPGLRDEAYARQALHNLLVCHGEAVRLFRGYSFKRAKIGIVVDVWHHYPLRKGNADDEALAELNNETAGYGMFLNPVFLGKYSDLWEAHMRAKGCMPVMEEGDLAVISSSVDYFGLNFYNAIYDRADAPVMLGGSNGGNFQQSDPSVAGIVFYDALRDVLSILYKKYRINVPVLITENGYTVFEERASADGVIHDEGRIAYIRNMLQRVRSLIEEGYPIQGYHYWSAFDNWEWSAGFSWRYGLISVDFATQTYRKKQSFAYYANVIRTNGEEL